MNTRPVLLMIALSLALTACGNKGPLVQAPVPVADPEMPAGSVPVEIEPQTTLPDVTPADPLPDPTATDPLIDTQDDPFPDPLPDPTPPPDPVPPPADDDGNG